MSQRTSRLSLMLTVLLVGCAYAAVLNNHQTVQRGYAQAVSPKPDDQSAPNVAPQGGIETRVGLTAAQAEFGRDLPTGVGVVFGHVEGNRGNYLPNTDRFPEVRISPLSGSSKPNGHANATAGVIYGSDGLAPGVDRVNAMTSSDFIGRLVLGLGTDRQPTAQGCHIFTHSWISSGGTFARRLLRRADHLIDQQGVIMVAGVNNGRNTATPGAMASAYNAIAVGNRGGNSSTGPTQVDGVGRCKPDLVAPKNLTSFSTPVVAALAARLLEAAWLHEQRDRAARPETIKAVLMAGAEKPGSWNPHDDQPLDLTLGAGSVRFDHSYRMMKNPATVPGRIGHTHGWAHESIDRTQTDQYWFETPQATGEFSVILTWHRRVDGRIVSDMLSNEKRWNHNTRLANLDLQLIRITDTGESQELAISRSRIDNVEHLYLPALEPGRYRLHVLRQDTLDEPWKYALAWRIEPGQE